MSAYIADDFKVSPKLTLNLGVRWEWFGWPEEKNGYIGNFDPALVTNFDNPLSGFIIPSDVDPTGFTAVDQASAFSNYHSAQFSLNKRMSRGLQFNLAYTYSKAMDNSSADPGSTAGGGKPDLPNVGFTARGTIDQLKQHGADKTEAYFNPSVLCSPLSLAGGYPNNRGFGNLGRNILRGTNQNRFDLGFAKNTNFTERLGMEFRWEIFNLFNNVNFGLPNNVIGDPGSGTDFNRITDTVDGPRVMQFGLKLKF